MYLDMVINVLPDKGGNPIQPDLEHYARVRWREGRRRRRRRRARLVSPLAFEFRANFELAVKYKLH